MKLRDGLVLREVAGQYVIVPTGAAVREVTDIVYISPSAAYLWNYMANHEFAKEDLVEQILDYYTGVTREQAENRSRLEKAKRWSSPYSATRSPPPKR